MHLKMLAVSLFVMLLEIYEVRGVGVATVGFNATTPQNLIIFTENDASPKLKVFLSDSAGGTPNVIGVTVACHLDSGQQTGAPFTTAAIASKTLNAAATGTPHLVEMDTTFSVSGRPVSYYCNATGNANFAAKSNTFSLQRKKAPTVSICSSVTEVPQQTKAGNLRVKMSDEIVNRNVNITCTAQSAAAGVLNVSIAVKEVPIGDGGLSKRIPVPYSVTTTGTENRVACTGNSADGVQYNSSNSGGSSTLMKMQSATVKFLPEQLTTSTHSFQLLVTLDSPVRRNTPEAFLCAVVKVVDTAAATAAVANPACKTATATPTVSGNSTNATGVTWSVTHRIEMTTGQVSQPVTVARSTVSMAATTERLVVTCCNNPSDTTSIYAGKFAAARVTAAFPGVVAINATVAKASSAETVLPNPAFVDPAPCPCDLTSDICDQGCCCDSLCNKTEPRITPCLTGYFGGDAATRPSKPHRCSLPVEQQTEDYHALMCIMYENNAVLGKFYTPTASKLSQEEVTAQVSGSSSVPQFSNDGVRSQSSTATLYKVGAAVTTVWNEGHSNSVDQTATLRLPGPGMKGSCDRNQAVRFLKDRQAFCDVAITATCSAELSARSYLLGGNLTHPACPTYPAVLAAMGTTFQVPTQAEYFCVDSAASTLTGTYIKSSASPSASPSASSSTGLENVVNCTYSDTTGNITCSKLQRLSSTNSSAPLTFKRCSFDDGYSAPPAVTYNTDTRNCDNAVLNVSYAFVWNETSITGLRVFVLMASVPAGQTLSQAFKVNFTHGSVTTGSSSVLTERSGVFGYEDGKPVIGGKQVGTAPNQYVDANATNWPFLLRPGPDGLCEQAGTEKVLFPYNSHSSCKIYLKLSDFSHCPTLRANLLSYLDLLTPFNVLATYGSPDINSEKDWAPLIQQTPPNVADNSSSSNITSSFDNTTTTPAPGTVTVNTGPFGEFLGGKCIDVPVGVTVSVMYADQGRARSQPIYQIIGVQKAYILKSIELNCLSSSEDGPCTNKNLGQQFFLDLNVFFRQVPATWKTSIYNLYKRGVPCWWDICIDDSLEIWYSSFYLGMRLDIVGYTLLIFLFGIPMVVFGWPW